MTTTSKPKPKRKKLLWIVIGSIVGLFLLLMTIGIIGVATQEGGWGAAMDEQIASQAAENERKVAEEQAPKDAEAAVETPEATEGDRTQEFKDANVGAAWVDQVAAVVETEPGRIEVETTLTDPRGDSGSPESQSAIEICEAAVALSAEYVAVYESDGTSWILYGHPSVAEGECSEV